MGRGAPIEEAALAEPTLYLFDGYNLLHAGGFRDRDEVVDRLAGFVALRGARGVVVFDGVGADGSVGPLEVRYATPADHLLERLAADHRDDERVYLVSSDADIRGTVGQEVRKRKSAEFARELRGDDRSRTAGADARSQVEDALDAETRSRLERWRRERP